MVWLLFACAVSLHGSLIPLPAVTVEGTYSAEDVCVAARQGANDEGRYNLTCVNGRDFIKVAVQYRECAESYVLTFREDERGGGY